MNYKQRFIECSILKEFDMITGAFKRLRILDTSRNGLQNLICEINSFNNDQRQRYQEEFHMFFPISIIVDNITGDTIACYSNGTARSNGRVRCNNNHPWYKMDFVSITHCINIAFNNIIIKAINDVSSSYQKYQTPFGILTYFNREYNGSFLGFDKLFNNTIFKKYNISKETIKDIYHVDEINGDWPYGTEKQVFDLVNYINKNCFTDIIEASQTYTIIQLKNKKYIAKFTNRTLSKEEYDLIRSHPGSSKKGVFPEFEKKEDLEDALKNLFK